MCCRKLWIIERHLSSHQLWLVCIRNRSFLCLCFSKFIWYTINVTCDRRYYYLIFVKIVIVVLNYFIELIKFKRLLLIIKTLSLQFTKHFILCFVSKMQTVLDIVSTFIFCVHRNKFYKINKYENMIYSSFEHSCEKITKIEKQIHVLR